MLQIIDLNAPPPEVENPYPYPLDTFQKWAFQAINQHENVLVTAKTGSGKTLVGEYQIKVSLAKGKRVFYTTPIKSLSNQKFHDLKEMGYSVGILTGDIKFCPHADVVVMTTEILCNLLFNETNPDVPLSLNNVDAIIFDEVHYINNPERGKVWEQCLMMLDPRINLVLLSATIEDAPKFATWLGDLKQKPIYLISTHYRVVPLLHKVGNEVLMDAHDIFYPDAYNRWLHKLEDARKNNAKHKAQVTNRRRGGYEDKSVSKQDRTHSFVHQMNECVSTLETAKQLPALFFVFSRKHCEQYAKKIEATLLTSSEVASVKHIMSFHLHRYETSPQYFDLKHLLEKGVAYHHSGLLPVLKEIIEILFSKGFVKVLFATETFAVGINMPTKTVVFTSFRKHDGCGMRVLRTDEYIQMAGRAGRRGKDTEGLVIYLPDREPETLEDVRRMMSGSSQKVYSRMDFGYDFLIKTFYGHEKDWRSLAKQSYWYQQNEEALIGMRIELQSLERERDALDITLSDIQRFSVRVQHEERVSYSVNAARRDAQKTLDVWNANNSDILSKWDTFKAWTALQKEVSRLGKDIQSSLDYESDIEPRIAFLTELGYLNKDSQLGECASHISEGHPILMSTAFMKKIFHGLDRDMLVGCLAIFMTNEDKDGEVSLDDCRCLNDEAIQDIKLLQHTASEYAHLDQDPQYWRTEPYWIDVAIRWVRGENPFQICGDYQIYEGNFIRAMLKLANILDEWVGMATRTQDLETLEICRDIRSVLVRGVVVPDSLYLRI